MRDESGTNSFHGDLFEFLRNGEMNARNAYALTNDGLKRNQFEWHSAESRLSLTK
jgi:hypothetical protein